MCPPFERLLRFHNLGEADNHPQFSRPELIVISGMDYRQELTLPHQFAYLIRTGDGSVRHNEFPLAYAVAMGRIAHVAIIGQTDGNMAELEGKKEAFVDGLVEIAGWDARDADWFFHKSRAKNEITEPASFAWAEAHRLAQSYPKVTFEPFLYDTAEGKLYYIKAFA
jgi:hypothetical protein